MNKSKTVYLVIGCDTDPDRSSLLDNLPAETLSWRGMLEGIPRAKKRLAQVHDSAGLPPVFSWCLRADEQIKSYYGSYNWVMKTHADFLLDLEKQGDELSWHPHFWRFDATKSVWYQECFDRQWQTTMLREAHAEYVQRLPGRAKSVRMGWDYHNNETYSTLESLGVTVDFSGIPGLGFKPSGPEIRSVNFFDWVKSPNHPYYPLRADYSKEAQDGDEAFRLIESPNFVSQSVVWSLIAGLQYARKMKNLRPLVRALVKPTYWIGTTGKTALFKPLVDQVVRQLKVSDTIVFVTYFHPDELLDNKHTLYSLEFMADNLSLLNAAVRKCGGSIRHIRASEIPGVWK